MLRSAEWDRRHRFPSCSRVKFLQVRVHGVGLRTLAVSLRIAARYPVALWTRPRAMVERGVEVAAQ
jgi:hypothetical protein